MLFLCRYKLFGFYYSLSRSTECIIHLYFCWPCQPFSFSHWYYYILSNNLFSLVKLWKSSYFTVLSQQHFIIAIEIYFISAVSSLMTFLTAMSISGLSMLHFYMLIFNYFLSLNSLDLILCSQYKAYCNCYVYFHSLQYSVVYKYWLTSYFY